MREADPMSEDIGDDSHQKGEITIKMKAIYTLAFILASMIVTY